MESSPLGGTYPTDHCIIDRQYKLQRTTTTTLSVYYYLPPEEVKLFTSQLVKLLTLSGGIKGGIKFPQLYKPRRAEFQGKMIFWAYRILRGAVKIKSGESGDKDNVKHFEFGRYLIPPPTHTHTLGSDVTLHLEGSFSMFDMQVGARLGH